MAHDGSNRSFDHLGIYGGHHDITHHNNREDWIEQCIQIETWYSLQVAKFLEKLKNSEDVDGNSVLANSQIIFGSGNADGNRHTHRDLPIILAGGGGGAYKTGRYANCGSVPLSNLFLSMAHQAGAKLENFGDSTGLVTDV
jgi:hypothetical protein